jgi:hypothetical protein
MVRKPMEIEGTWDQLEALAPSLAGLRLRLTVLGSVGESASGTESVRYIPLSERLSAIRDEDTAAWDSVPADLAEQHDHYAYGWPKR